MGKLYLFECPKCAYRAKVSGGDESGITFSSRTITCRDCKLLYEIVTRIRLPLEKPKKKFSSGLGNLSQLRWLPDNPPTFDAALNRLTMVAIKNSRWVDLRVRCPVSRFHRVETWKNPRKCPRCGSYMEGTATPYRIWD
jgi:hypothetical protein